MSSSQTSSSVVRYRDVVRPRLFSSKAFCCVALLAPFTLLFAGCWGQQSAEGPLARVEGVVTVKGQPATDAVVRFYGPAGRPIRMVRVGADGSFSCEAGVGMNDITIAPPTQDFSASEMEGKDPDSLYKPLLPIPRAYGARENGLIKREVKQREVNKFEFAIK